MRDIRDTLNAIIVADPRRRDFLVSHEDYQRIINDLSALYPLSIRSHDGITSLPYGSLEIRPSDTVTESIYASRP